MRIVYTSIDNLVLGKKIAVKSYRELSEDFAEWIVRNTERLLKNRLNSELKAASDLRKLTSDFLEQPFFMIDGRSYFLDFYVPRFRLAIEIDGKSHRGRSQIDKQRDGDFASIGIRTIRISANDVLMGRFITALQEKMTSKPKRKKRKPCVQNFKERPFKSKGAK